MNVFFNDTTLKLCATYSKLASGLRQYQTIPRVLMVQPPSSEVELKALDGLWIETIAIYSGESAPANSTLLHCDHISHMYEQNQQRLVQIQRAFKIKRHQQQQPLPQWHQERWQQEQLQQQQEQHRWQTINVVRPQQQHQQESQLDHLYSDISDPEVDATPADDNLVIIISNDDDQPTAWWKIWTFAYFFGK